MQDRGGLEANAAQQIYRAILGKRFVNGNSEQDQQDPYLTQDVGTNTKDDGVIQKKGKALDPTQTKNNTLLAKLKT